MSINGVDTGLTANNRSTYKFTASQHKSEFEAVVRKANHAAWARDAACAAVLVALSAATVATPAPHTGIRITDHLYGTHFVDAENGWVVGAFGTILRTRDGGNSWQLQEAHTAEHLYSVHFADAQHGWVAGRSGVIRHTSNGGDAWEPQSAGTDRPLFDVQALDAQRAWIVGDWGTIFATHNGGQTWETRSLNRDVILNALSWPDDQHGWIVGEGGTVIATTDGGNTWVDQASGVTKTLFGVDFTDVQHGWAVGLDGLILRTTNGGHTWQVQHGDTAAAALEQVGFQEAMDNPSLYAVAVAGNLGYAVGDSGGVFATEDGGETWHRKAMPAAANLRWIRALSLVSGSRGIFVGANGLTVRVAGQQIRLPEGEEHAAQVGD